MDQNVYIEGTNQDLFLQEVDKDLPPKLTGLPDDIFKLRESLPQGTKLVHLKNIFDREEGEGKVAKGVLKILKLSLPERKGAVGEMKKEYANEIFLFANYGLSTLQMYIDSQNYNVGITKDLLGIENAITMPNYNGPKVLSISFINMPTSIPEAAGMLTSLSPRMIQIMSRVKSLGLDRTQEIHSIMIYPPSLKYVINQFNSTIRMKMQDFTRFELYNELGKNEEPELTKIIKDKLVSQTEQ